MNLDLLKKLTKLANNNPNDNEANSAARRVCKMLEEGNWNLVSVPNIPKFEGGNKGGDKTWTYKPSKAQEDFVNDNRNYDWVFWDDMFNKAREKSKQKPFRENQWSNPFEEEKRQVRSKQVACTKCQYEFTVAESTDPLTFICTICRR